MGALLARGLVGIGLEGGLDAMRGSTLDLPPAARDQVAQALARVFATGAVMAGLALVASFFLPPVDFSAGVPESAGEADAGRGDGDRKTEL